MGAYFILYFLRKGETIVKTYYVRTFREGQPYDIKGIKGLNMLSKYLYKLLGMGMLDIRVGIWDRGDKPLIRLSAEYFSVLSVADMDVIQLATKLNRELHAACMA